MLPLPPTAPVRKEINNWTRVTSLTVFQGRMFASIGSCTSSVQDAPAGVRGSVHSVQAGQCVSYDKDLGYGWQHLTALREGGELRLYINGRLASKSEPFNADNYDLTIKQPLQIGFGEQDYFTGRIREVRLHQRALTNHEIKTLAEVTLD